MKEHMEKKEVQGRKWLLGEEGWWGTVRIYVNVEQELGDKSEKLALNDSDAESQEKTTTVWMLRSPMGAEPPPSSQEPSTAALKVQGTLIISVAAYGILLVIAH